MKTILFLIAGLLPYRDPITGTDLSGRDQIIKVGEKMNKPVILRVLKNGDICPSCSLELILVTERGTHREVILSDSLGLVRWQYVKEFDEPGKAKVIFKMNDEIFETNIYVVEKNAVGLLLLKLIVGFVFFFFGLLRAGEGFNRLFGARIKRLLLHYSQNPLLAYIAGFLATLMLQSSTATSLVIISLVNMEVITLSQALATCLGASLGTTFTVQILAFRVFELMFFLLIIGFPLERMRGNIRNWGRVFFGFGLIFFGIYFMKTGFLEIKNFPWFENFINTMKSSPFYLLLFGFILTGLVHSSAVTIGIALSLVFSNLIFPKEAFFIVLGANLGTPTTSLIASLPLSGNAKRAAWGYFLFKLMGLIPFLFIIPWVEGIMDFITKDPARQVSNFHFIFNLFIGLIFLPTLPLWVKCCQFFVPVRERELKRIITPDIFDKEHPELVFSFIHRKVIEAGDIIYFMLRESIKTFKEKNTALIYRLISEDDEIDKLEETLTLQLTKLLYEELEEKLLQRVKAILLIIEELEHIGDIISKSIMRFAERIYKEGLEFSKEEIEEVSYLHREVLLTMEHAINSLTTFDREEALIAFNRKDYVVTVLRELEMKHLRRLATGAKEAILTSTIYLDLISDYERINFHAASIGNAILEHVYGART